MQERLNKYKNVRFMPFQPINDLTQWLQFADIHLIPQRISAADLLLPSKLLGICASAKPIIGFAKSNSELGKII